MITFIAWLICLGVICAANPENAECTNPIRCPFGSKGETIRVCAPVASDSAAVCSRFTKCDNCTTTTICSKCPGNLEAPSRSQGRESNSHGIVSENTIQSGIAKSRQKRQFALPDRGPNRGRPTNGFRESPTVLSCPTLDGSNLGSLECKRVSSTEETCVGKCWDGYHFDVLNFEEEVTLECRRGVWSPIDAFPDCKRNPTGTLTFCRDPGINSHSDRIPKVPPSHFGFPQGSRLNYSCDPGYTMKGEGNLFCMESGKWSHSRPRCIAKSPIPGDNCVEAKANDCADLLQMGHNTSGVYQVHPMNRLTDGRIIDVYCDMDTSAGGWTVIQRRGTFIAGENENFNRDWHDYKVGFGDINKEFWLGNDNIFALTNQKLYSVRFDLKDIDENKAYALYERFWIEEEFNNYTLHISGYSGNAGDAMKYHNNYRFSTYDKDNDINEKDNCAMYFQAGWWYYSCLQANLNGLYHPDGKQEPYSSGVNWYYWRTPNVSLTWTEIKIRPRNFSPFVLG